MLRLFGFGALEGSAASAPLTSLGPTPLETMMLAASVDAVLATDANERITYANPAAIDLLGRLPERVIGESIVDIFARDTRDEMRAAMRAARDGLPQRCEALLVDAAGQERTVSIAIGRITAGDTLIGTVLTVRDISDERRAHQELARSESRYRHLFEDASDAIMTFDSLGRFTSVNDAGERISGYSREELIGRFFGPLLPLAELPRAVLEFKRALSGQPGQFESIVIRKDGERRHITITYSCPQRSREVLCLIRDATDEKQLQQQLIQSEKMAAIGQLVSGVAHELNNPLASIAAFAQLMLANPDLSLDQRHSADVISSEARRAARIVHNLLTFARQHKAEKVFASINQVLENTLELRAYELNVRGIRLSREFEEPPPSTMVDVHQLQQVLLNLVTNAEQAMSEIQRPYHRLTLRSRAMRDVVRIEVEDTGAGIPPDSLERIFNPFYTTKPVGQGTGLGLSISLGIISEHGGRIWAENIPSGGSRFCVELPLVAPEEVPAPPTDAAGAEPAKGLRVLVADDEPPLRAALGRLLARAGHDVVSVGSGNEALAQAALDVFDAILLDIRMPDISGKDVFLRWQAERPDLAERVVFLTGDIVSADLQQFLIASGRPYVPKPFEFSAVLKVLPHR